MESVSRCIGHARITTLLGGFDSVKGSGGHRMVLQDRSGKKRGDGLYEVGEEENEPDHVMLRSQLAL